MSPVCAFAKSDMTPCVVRDGDVCYDDSGRCVGCNRRRAEIAPTRASDHGMRVPLVGGPIDGEQIVVHSSVSGIRLVLEGGCYEWGIAQPGSFEGADDEGTPIFVVEARWRADPEVTP